MKKIFALAMVASILVPSLKAQEEETKPEYLWTWPSSAPTCGSTTSLMNGETELVKITYGQDAVRAAGSADGVFTFTLKDAYTSSKSPITVNDRTISYKSGGSGNPEVITGEGYTDVTKTSISLTSHPNIGTYLILTPSTPAVITFYIGNLANTKGVFVIADGKTSPATLQYTTSTTAVAEDGWQEFTNGANTQSIGATGSANYAFRFTASADVDYYICVAGSKMAFYGFTYQEGEEEKLAEALKVGYIYQGNIDDELIFNQSLQIFDATAIDADTTKITADSLLSFDALVYASSLKASNDFAKSLVNYDNMIPVLNLSASLYEAWGWGTVASSTSAAMTIGNEDNYEHELFAQISSAGEGAITFFEGAEVATCPAAEGSLIANDELLASNESGECIHMHGNGRNEYIGVNFPAVITVENLSEDAVQFVNNAVPYIAATKKRVVATTAPKIAQSYADGVTTVSLSAASGATIYYAMGEDEYQLYAEPLQVTKDSTAIKAYAQLHGYYDSNVSSSVVIVKTQAKMPTLAADMQEGKTVVTLSVDAGSTTYFNFAGLKVADGSKAYEESFEVTEPGTITYFAAGDNLLPSEIQTYDIKVAGIPAVKDTVAHFTADQNDWVDNAVLSDSSSLTTSSGAIYYFGKNAWNYYSTTEYDSIVTVKDSLGNVLKCIDGETDSTKTYFKADTATIKTVSSAADTQWMIMSHGQVITCESTLAVESGMGIDDGVGNEKKGRYAASIFDCLGGIASKGCVDFGGKTSGEPYSMEIASTVKFTAPFDIVTYLGNGSTGSPVIVAQTSTDGENWNTVDTLNYSTTQRYWRKTRMHVADAGEYYVRVAQVSGATKAQLYDIYVITTEGTTGIESVNANDNLNHNANIFDLQGRRVNVMTPGQLYFQNGKKVMKK